MDEVERMITKLSGLSELCKWLASETHITLPQVISRITSVLSRIPVNLFGTISEIKRG